MNATTRRGFTMHEHLDSTGLIHMNGRVYDPLVARFLSADPLLDGATNPHGWNRFGYAKNRPLTFTDPHGFCSDCHNGGGGGGSSSSSGGGFFSWVRGLFGRDGGSRGGGASFADLSPVRVTIPRLNDDLTPMQTVTVFGDPTPPSPELRVDFSPFDEPSGGPMPRSFGGGGAPPEDEPEVEPIKNWLCEAGNAVAGWADSLGNVSGPLELTGLGIAGTGFVTAQPEVTAPGLALAATGGVGNIGAGVLQLGAGLLQGAGGGGYSNSGYAALSLATGFTLARGIIGSPVSGYRTVSERASDAIANGTATVAGGVNDIWTSLIDAASPRQVKCPGGT